MSLTVSELRRLLGSSSSRRGTSSPAEAEVRAQAHDLAKTLKATIPPIDPVPFLKARSINRTQLVDMGEEGVLYALDDRTFGVDVKRSSSPARRTFTLMHEVGHTFFVDRSKLEWYRAFRVIDKDIESPAAKSSNSLEERLCNVLAGEILLPTKYVQQALLKQDLSWRTIFEIQHESKCSLTSCAVRSVQSSLARAILAYWQPVDRDGERVGLRLAWQISSPGVSSSVDAGFIARKGSQPYEAMNSPAQRKILTGKSFYGMQPQGAEWFYSESICPGRESGTVLTLIFLEAHAEVFGSAAPKWHRKNSVQAELFP